MFNWVTDFSGKAARKAECQHQTKFVHYTVLL